MPGPRNSRSFTMRWLAVLIALAAIAGGCGDDAGDTTTSLVADETTTTTTGPSTTTALATPATTTTSSPELPGDPYAGPGPQAGEALIVVGVAFDEMLDLYSGPGDGFDVLAMLPPDAESLSAENKARLVDHTIWYEIEIDGEVGWVDAAYLALPGATDDAASEIVAVHGSIPSADTMEGLGLAVAETYAGGEGGTITMTVAPSVGELGEVTYDVLGLADDAIIGYRLHVFGQQDGGAGPFSLHSVERAMLCWRGVTDDGLCI